MKRDYIHIKHTKTITRQQVERQEEVLYSTHKPLTVFWSHHVFQHQFRNFQMYICSVPHRDIFLRAVLWILIPVEEDIFRSLTLVKVVISRKTPAFKTLSIISKMYSLYQKLKNVFFLIHPLKCLISFLWLSLLFCRNYTQSSLFFWILFFSPHNALCNFCFEKCYTDRRSLVDVHSFTYHNHELFKHFTHFCVQCLKDLKQDFLQKKDRYENVSSISGMKVALDDLKKTMAWCLVRAIIHQNHLKFCLFTTVLSAF